MPASRHPAVQQQVEERRRAVQPQHVRDVGQVVRGDADRDRLVDPVAAVEDACPEQQRRGGQERERGGDGAGHARQPGTGSGVRTRPDNEWQQVPTWGAGYPAAADVQQGPRRQPRGDRRARHPRARRARHRVGGRLLRGRPRRAARQARRRGLPDRARPGHRDLPRRSTSCSRSIEESGAEAVHPGYGFLAENAAFATALEENGITFIGPPASRDRGDGLQDPGARADEERRRADRARHHRAGRDARGRAEDRRGHRLPDRGQGRGRRRRQGLPRRRWSPTSSQDAFEGAAREGEKFFSDDTVYLERYLPDPRHVEVQVLADKHGNTIHLGERDCSIQRRHQKLIEESPAPLVDDELREKIGKIAVDAAKAVGYHSAGTIEGLLAGRRVLLPRDEHARAGRALRDRGGHRHRHRARADPDRRRRDAVDHAGRRRAARPRDRVPHQRRGRRQELRPRPRHGHALPRAERARRARRLRRAVAARRSRRSTTRWSPS